MTMAISSSFASRLVLCIAPALSFLFVSSIPTSYATPIYLPPYDARRMDAIVYQFVLLKPSSRLRKLLCCFLLMGTLDVPAQPLRGTAIPSTHTSSVPSLSKTSSSITSTQSFYYSALALRNSTK